jgi:hypothetical protein
MIFSLKLDQNDKFLLWFRWAVLTNINGFLLLHIGTVTCIQCHSSSVELDKEKIFKEAGKGEEELVVVV